MAFPFYILYATEKLHFTEQVIGVFIVAQTGGVLVAGLVLGRVADRHGAQRAIQIGALLALTAPILALTIAFAGQNVAGILRNAYAWIYICIGLADNLIMLGYLNYTIDITPPGQRAIYMGIFNALATIGVLGPTIAGWLLSRTSYPVLFGVTLAIGTAALALAFSLPASRELAQPVPQAAAPAPADQK
jgi:MFS family permease